MTKLSFITGPMFSGKTTKLMRVKDERHPDIDINSVVIINNIIDNRYSTEGYIATHNGIKKKCIKTDKLMNILNDIRYKKLVLIDESQFFDDLIDFIEFAKYDNNIHYIYLAGLNYDFNMNPFKNIKGIEYLVDEFIYLKSTCKDCKNPAEFTKLISCDDQTNILRVGGHNDYINICIDCVNTFKQK